jgi:hypothetical protein
MLDAPLGRGCSNLCYTLNILLDTNFIASLYSLASILSIKIAKASRLYPSKCFSRPLISTNTKNTRDAVLLFPSTKG